MPTAYGYLRVSSDAEAASGLGLDAQLQWIRAEQARLRAVGARVGTVYRDEAVSAARYAMRGRPVRPSTPRSRRAITFASPSWTALSARNGMRRSPWEPGFLAA